MENEPEIIKQLKEEEKLGRLYSKVHSTYEELEMLEKRAEDVPDTTVGFIEDDVEKKPVGNASSYEDKKRSFWKGEEIYRKIFEVAPEAIVVIDKKGTLLEINGRVYDWLGYKPEEVVEQNLLKLPFLSKDSKSKVKKNFFLRMLGKKIPPYDLDFIAKSGEKVIGRIHAAPIRDENKKVIGDLVLISDVTKQKKAEDALIESEERFKDLFENANDLIQSIGPNGRFIYVNKSWLETLGYTEKELEGLILTDILRKDQIPHCMEIFRKVCSGKSFDRVETVFISKDGREIYLEGNVNARFKDGKFIATRGIFRDVTARKKAEDKIRKSEEKFRLIFENSAVAITFTDEKERIISWNKFTEELLGMRKDDLYLKPVKSLYPFEEWKKIRSQNIQQKGMLHHLETKMFRKNKESIDVDISLSVLKDHEGKITGSIGVIKDITKRKKAEDELERSKRRIELQNIKLKKLDQLKTDFLNITSHELRTPITPIKGYLQMLLKQKIGGITEEQKKVLSIIQRNTDRLDHLIQDLLDVSRLESGTMKFIPEQTDINMLIDETAETMQSSADSKNIKINVDLEEKIPDLTIDQDRIKQVIMNLIDNAIKFSPNSSVINICAKKEENNVLFEVQDFGRGIPKDEQTRIFETFFQVDSGMDRKFGGVGLGLSISRGIVLAHGGRIWVESTVGKGSTFRFTLPIEPTLDVEGKFKEIDMFGLENKKLYYFPEIVSPWKTKEA